jgi:phosphatidate cytidylyltransferase
LLLGLGGAAVILYGQQAVLAVAVLVVYQATQEYYGFMTSKGMSKGMTPPPRVISVVTTVLCVSMSFLAYYVNGRSGTVLALAGFSLLVMQVLAIKKPKFSQLATSVFGLFYCGMFFAIVLAFPI